VVHEANKMHSKVTSSLFQRVAMLSVALAISILLVSGSGTAAINPKPVRGYVWDSAGTLVDGADVTVNIKQGVVIRSTLTDTTDSAGFYSVVFLSGQWDIGDTIEVIASFSGDQTDPNSTAATSALVQWVNVTFDYVIPEFGSTTGLLVTGALLGAIGVVALVYFKKR
jgi:hypothetical protein